MTRCGQSGGGRCCTDIALITPSTANQQLKWSLFTEVALDGNYTNRVGSYILCNISEI